MNLTRQHNLSHDRLAKAFSWLMAGLCTACTIVILAVLLLVTGYLVKLGISSISLDFFTQLPSGDVASPGGMKHALIGTGILILLASSVGIPAGMLTGIYLAEYSTNSWLSAPVRFVCDVLAGVPSIVVGILGYELLVVPFSTGRLFGMEIPILTHLGISGRNGFAGALALAFIMIPIVARTTEEMLRLVPQSYREASIALGASKARTILTVVIPAATGSVVTGIMLAIARVAGETAPLIFTALGSNLLTLDPRQQFPSLTMQIFQYATGPYPKQRELAWAGILVLITLIFILNLAIRFATRKSRPTN
jgi:phosphate transport system permease protein